MDLFLLTPGGCFTRPFMSSPKCSLEIFVLQKLYLLWEFQAETLYMCPKPLVWAHVQRVSSKLSLWMWFLVLYIFTGLFWRARGILVKKTQVPSITRSLAGTLLTLQLEALNVVQYNMVFHTTLQWLKHHINQSYHIRQPISRPKGWDMGCLLWRFSRKLTAY